MWYEIHGMDDRPFLPGLLGIFDFRLLWALLGAEAGLYFPFLLLLRLLFDFRVIDLRRFM